MKQKTKPSIGKYESTGNKKITQKPSNIAAVSSRRAVRARRTPNLTPYEENEQIALAENYLNNRFGDRWEHVPGQRWAKVQYIRKLKRMGARKGSLDIRIYEPVLDRESGQIFNGCAVEMKRQKGGRVSEDQRRFAQMLWNCGWLVLFCRGAQDAINKIEEVYGK